MSSWAAERSFLADFLPTVRTVAVLGAHADPSRPAAYVPAALARSGVRVLPVNAALASPGATLFGEPVRASLAEIDEPVDIVDVFRRPDALPAHLPEILAMRPAPRLVWLQSGIRNDAFASALADAGIPIVQDLCLMVEHRPYARRDR